MQFRHLIHFLTPKNGSFLQFTHKCLSNDGLVWLFINSIFSLDGDIQLLFVNIESLFFFLFIYFLLLFFFFLLDGPLVSHVHAFLKMLYGKLSLLYIPFINLKGIIFQEIRCLLELLGVLSILFLLLSKNFFCF
jgi:hypothetical protein